MFWFKSCPKYSTGDLYAGQDRLGQDRLGQDRFSRYIACLQRGHYLTEAEDLVLRYVAGTGTPRPGQVEHRSKASGSSKLGKPGSGNRVLAGVG